MSRLLHNKGYISDEYNIVFYRLKFLGCITSEATSVSCESESYTPNPRLNTIESNDATKYRHFAVDTTTTPVEKKIIYFCDLNPYRSGMFCYCSIRKWEGGSENVPVEANTWSGNFMEDKRNTSA